LRANKTRDEEERQEMRKKGRRLTKRENIYGKRY